MYCHLQLERLVSECTEVIDLVETDHRDCRTERSSANVTSRSSTRYSGVGERDLATLTFMSPAFEARSCTSVRFARTASMSSFIPASIVLVSLTPANSAILAASAISCNYKNKTASYHIYTSHRPVINVKASFCA